MAVASLTRARGSEYRLLLFVAAVLAVGGWLLVVNVPSLAPAHTVQELALLFGLYALASLFLSFRLPTADQVLLPVVAMLTAIGLLSIRRLSTTALYASSADRQIVWLAAGIVVLMATITLVPRLENLKRYKYTAAVAGFLLILGTIRFGVDITGGPYRRWFGFHGIYFQPVEILKVLVVIFYAAYLEEKREVLSLAEFRLGRLRLPPLQYLGPLFLTWLLSLLLLTFQNDLGSALLFFGIFLAMLYVASERRSYLWIGIGVFLVGVVLAFRLFPHVRQRADIWLDPWRYAHDQAYQVVQGLIALANGGVVGSGLGQGHPGFVPVANTDFIFTSVGEELGLGGGMAVLGLFLVFAFRGLRIAALARDPFERLMAVGLTSTLAIQALVIVGGNLRLMPLTGVTLPFMSYGGSSLLANFVIIGLLLRISAHE
ncbi:MAG TPA: FtsW/RodA/SpoVE family cell cycle protein [Chloroflexota bacterium]|nr:FtsW/RodA/SpoVE family cell cycle protein [Chloroflexota bacterium]